MGTSIPNRSNVAWILSALVLSVTLAGGCMPVTGGGNGTALVETQLSADTGDAGTVQVTDGVAAQSAGEAVVTGDAPADATSARVSVSPANVQFVSADVGGAAQEVPTGGREAQVTIHIAGPGATDPCGDEFTVLDFAARESANGSITLTGDTSVSLRGTGIQRVVSGQFTVCIQVVANFNGTVVVSTINIVARSSSHGNGSSDSGDLSSNGSGDDSGDDLNSNGIDDDSGDDSDDDLNSNGVDDDSDDDLDTNGVDDDSDDDSDDDLDTNGVDDDSDDLDTNGVDDDSDDLDTNGVADDSDDDVNSNGLGDDDDLDTNGDQSSPASPGSQRQHRWAIHRKRARRL